MSILRCQGALCGDLFDIAESLGESIRLWLCLRRNCSKFGRDRRWMSGLVNIDFCERIAKIELLLYKSQGFPHGYSSSPVTIAEDSVSKNGLVPFFKKRITRTQMILRPLRFRPPLINSIPRVVSAIINLWWRRLVKSTRWSRKVAAVRRSAIEAPEDIIWLRSRVIIWTPSSEPAGGTFPAFLLLQGPPFALGSF